MNVMASDSAEYAAVRRVFDRWADAVQRCDLDRVVANHPPDVLMFDVPEPGHIKGMKAYRESWEEFFPFIADGGVFEITELEITAGSDVAFSHCVVNCGGSPDKTFPVRLTLGYRKVDGQWMIAHEHHSVAAKPD